MKSKFNNVLEMVGNTPVLKINNIDTGKCDLYVKMESLNPFGSIKDRVGLKMIQDAEAQGLIKEGSTIIESTAGNTGLGLALAAKLKGYKLILVIPDKMSEEKIRHLEAMGVDIIMTRSDVENGHPEHYQSIAEKLLKSTPNSFFANQFENKSNPQVHFETTGPEIWEQMEGNIDAFVAGVGTGGTISGVGKYLKGKKKGIKVIAVEPEDSAVISGGEPGSHSIQGIGAGFIPKNLNLKVIDEVVPISNTSAFQFSKALGKYEGIAGGISSGAVLAAAAEIHEDKKMHERNSVIIIPSFAERYLSTQLFSEF